MFLCEIYREKYQKIHRIRQDRRVNSQVRVAVKPSTRNLNRSGNISVYSTFKWRTCLEMVFRQ